MGMSWSSGWFCQYSSEDGHTHTSTFSLSRAGLQLEDWDEGRQSTGLTKDEQQLLSSAQSEDRDEAPAFPVDDVMDGVTEAGLPLLPLLVNVRPVGGLLGQVDGRDRIRKTGWLFSAPARRHPTVIRMSGFTLGISAAIRWRSS